MKYNRGAKRLKTSIVVLSILFALIMILRSFSIAHSPNRPNSFTQEGFTISFLGAHAEIQMNGSGYTAYWSIEILSNKGLNLQEFNATGIKSIVTAQQNSVVLTVENHNFKAAEIYSFGGGSIDASIALENTRTVNTSYIATFVLITNHRDHVNISGFSGSSLNIPVNQRPVLAVINQHSWLYNDQHIHLSWESSMGLFHGGLMTSNVSNNLISLPFGPFDLSKNSTYSIDPTITPDKFVGGGGGGGSGGSGSAPSVSMNQVTGISSSDNTFAPDAHTINFTGNVISMGGASSVLLNFYGIAKYGQSTSSIKFFSESVSSAGSFNYPYTPKYPGNYSGFMLGASNKYGYTNVTSGPSMKIYSQITHLSVTGSRIYSTDTSATEPAYNITGVVIGYATITMSGPVSEMTSAKYGASFETSYLDYNNNSMGVHSYNQTFNWIGNSAGAIPSDDSGFMSNIATSVSYQSAENNSWSLADQSLWYALTDALAGCLYTFPASVVLSAIAPFAFARISESLPQGNNSIVVGHTAYYSALAGYDVITKGAFSSAPVWTFDFNDTLEFQTVATGYTPTNAVLNYFTYSANYGISFERYQLVKCSVSEPIYIGQYY